MATDLTNRQQYLIRDLAGDQHKYNLLERYYEGDAPLPEGAEGASVAYRRFQKKSRLNIAQLAVSALRERLIIGGFRTGADGDENGDNLARRLWKSINGDVIAADTHNNAFIFGEAYLIVGPPNAFGYPAVTVEDPRQIEVKTDPMIHASLPTL